MILYIKYAQNKAIKQLVNQKAIKKERVAFMKYVDFARVHNYDLRKLLKYDIMSTPFYLTKEQYLRKAEFAQKRKESFSGKMSQHSSCVKY